MAEMTTGAQTIVTMLEQAARDIRAGKDGYFLLIQLVGESGVNDKKKAVAAFYNHGSFGGKFNKIIELATSALGMHLSARPATDAFGNERVH